MKTETAIVFIEIPPAAGKEFTAFFGHDHHHEGEDFVLDPSIPLPAEIPEGGGKPALADLNAEMILSAALHILSDPSPFSLDAARLGYYRRLVLAARPHIRQEFTEAAILKARNRDFDMALEILGALEGLYPEDPLVLYNRALVLEERAGGSGDAAEAWDAVAALEPPFPAGLFNGAFFFMKQGNISRSRECLSRYLSLAEEFLPFDREDPEDEEAGAEGEEEDGPFASEKIAEARAMLKKIEEDHLEDDDYREACLLVRGGREEEALPGIRRFLERYPSVQNAWFLLGWALRKLGRWEDGKAALGKALELGADADENLKDIHNELAICLMESGDYEGARRELETALREDPENIKIISNLGVLAMKTGDEDRAHNFFRIVLELDPEDPVANTFLEGK
ncbi:MAG: tetratricopeptide repeat protein [Treponema sp.]|jgi:tetratricopeptide (TPR) repeat protein|nr:tetratricopeptide repeat protein [Treponema sp.]